ncbi:MAG: hypothetical protein ACREVW_04560, partial [Burkholderiales bacterium]
ALQHGLGMKFRTWFGERINTPSSMDSDTSDVTRLLDYKVIRGLFGQYEGRMGDQLVYWQFVRQHFLLPHGFRDVSREMLPEMASALERDRLEATPTLVVDL